jgi:hypothetical protein
VTESPTASETSIGRVVIEFGFNRWVLVTIGSDQAQEQIGSSKELTAYLQRRGLPEQEARILASSAWKERPGDASVTSAHANESLLASTGLSSGSVLVFLVLFVLAWALVVLYAINHWPR